MKSYVIGHKHWAQGLMADIDDKKKTLYLVQNAKALSDMCSAVDSLGAKGDTRWGKVDSLESRPKTAKVTYGERSWC